MTIDEAYTRGVGDEVARDECTRWCPLCGSEYERVQRVSNLGDVRLANASTCARRSKTRLGQWSSDGKDEVFPLLCLPDDRRAAHKRANLRSFYPLRVDGETQLEVEFARL